MELQKEFLFPVNCTVYYTQSIDRIGSTDQSRACVALLHTGALSMKGTKTRSITQLPRAPCFCLFRETWTSNVFFRQRIVCSVPPSLQPSSSEDLPCSARMAHTAYKEKNRIALKSAYIWLAYSQVEGVEHTEAGEKLSHFQHTAVFFAYFITRKALLLRGRIYSVPKQELDQQRQLGGVECASSEKG